MNERHSCEYASGTAAKTSVQVAERSHRKPSNFTQWARAAQRQQKNSLRKRSIHDDYDTVSNTVEKGQPRSTKRWGWQRTGKTGRTWRKSPDRPGHLVLPTTMSTKPTVLRVLGKRRTSQGESERDEENATSAAEEATTRKSALGVSWVDQNRLKMGSQRSQPSHPKIAFDGCAFPCHVKLGARYYLFRAFTPTACLGIESTEIRLPLCRCQ